MERKLEHKTVKLSKCSSSKKEGGSELIKSISGYASVFGNEDSHGDIIEPGAFTKTIAAFKQRGIKLFSSHSMNATDLIGSITELEQDGIGLKFDSSVSSAPTSQDFAIKAQEGHLDEVSIGFYITDSEVKKNSSGDRIRHIKEIELVEISLVSRASNSLANLTNVKHEETHMSEQENKEPVVKAEDKVSSVDNTAQIEEMKALKDELLALKKDLSQPVRKTETPVVEAVVESSKTLEQKEYNDLFDYVYNKGYETKALNSAVLADGGALVAETMINRINLKRDQINRVQSRVTRINHVGPLNLLDYEFVEEHNAIGENVTQTVQDVSDAFGKSRLDAQDFMSIIKISNRLDRRNAVGSLQSFFIDRYAVRRANNMEQHILKGTGDNQPLGVITLLEALAFNEVTVASGTAFSNVDYDECVDLLMKLDEQYRNENTAFYVSKEFMTRVMKLKDSNSMPIWTHPVGGNPATLLGIPIFESPVLDADGTSGNVGAVVGDFSQYLIVDEQKFSVAVDESKYRESNQIGLFMNSAYDGMPTDKNAFATLSIT